MVLIEVMKDGRRVRYCGAKCHRAKPGPSRCICGGYLRGIEFRGLDPAGVDPGFLEWIRAHIELREGEYVQMRIGA